MVGLPYQRPERIVVLMMVTLGVYLRRGRRLMRRWAADPRVHTLLQGALYLLSGFLSSGASLLHWAQPLSLGLICTHSGWPAALLTLGSIGGACLFWGSAGTQGILWAVLALGTVLILGERPVFRETPLLMPALAGFLVAVTGLILQYLHLETPPVAVYLLRIAMAVFSCFVFCRVTRQQDPVTQWLACGLGVLALAQVIPFPYLGLGYIAAGAIAMAGALPAAALAGLALDLAQVTAVPMAAVVCLSYLTRLIPGLRSNWRYTAPGFCYLLIMGLCGQWDPYPLPGLILGGFAAMALPGRPELAHRRGETGTAQVQLEMVSSVLQQTRALLAQSEEAPIDEQALILRAAERACSNCPNRKSCPERPQDLPTSLLHKPLGNGADLPSGCKKSGRLLQELRRSQEQLRSIRADRDRQTEYRTAVEQQYQFLSAYLQELSDSLAHRMSAPKINFQPEVSSCSASLHRSSGDRCLWFAGVQCKYYVLLCDGMGTGAEAARDAQQAATLLQRLLGAGFPAAHALKSLNSLCALQGRAGAVTVDLAELRLDTGKVTLYKWGAAPSYIISRGESIRVGSATPPPGLSVADGREAVERLSLRRGETLVLLSDGAGGEEALHRAWQEAAPPAGDLAARILQYSSPSADDATVAVIRLHGVAYPEL